MTRSWIPDAGDLIWLTFDVSSGRRTKTHPPATIAPLPKPDYGPRGELDSVD